MTASTLLLLVFNGLASGVVLVMMFVLMRSAALYTWHVGNFTEQTRLKWRILKLLLASIAIGFLAGLVNLIFG